MNALTFSRSQVELNIATSSCACSSNIDIAALQVLQAGLKFCVEGLFWNEGDNYT